MENEVQIIHTWGYWVIGVLQIVAIIAALRVGRLINTCLDAHEWGSNTRSLHFNISAFLDQVGETYTTANNVPIQIVFTFAVNCFMAYLISIGSVNHVMAIIAAAVNASTIVSFVSSTQAIDNILTFIAQVTVSNIGQDDTEENSD